MTDTYFGAGGALGFDTLAAQTVLELKKKYPDIRLILVLPCLSQTRNWKAANISEYERIKQKQTRLFIHQKNIREIVCSKEIATLSITAACVFAI